MNEDVIKTLQDLIRAVHENTRAIRDLERNINFYRPDVEPPATAVDIPFPESVGTTEPQPEQPAGPEEMTHAGVKTWLLELTKADKIKGGAIKTLLAKYGVKVVAELPAEKLPEFVGEVLCSL